MRATRNRVYGVTRIGGSNPSSSAILIKKTLENSVFFRMRRKHGIGFQDSLDAFILAMMPSCC